MYKPTTIFFFSLFLLTFNGVGIGAEKTVIPEWLDTIAPKIMISPDSNYHNSLFYVSFTSNKRSTIWFSVGTSHEMMRYSKPFTVDKDGFYTVYYYGEDDFGNKSGLDSINYVFDSRPPVLRVAPSSGTYPQSLSIRVTADEPCSFYFQKNGTGQPVAFTDSLQIRDHFEGIIIAEDRAGNRNQSSPLKYTIDTSSFNIKIDPAGGIFNHCGLVTLSASENVIIFYSFDPLAPPDYFNRYEKPILLSHGLSILRYFGRRTGNESEIYKARYIVDTIAPKLQFEVSSGQAADTLYFSTREKSVIRYTLDKTVPNVNSRIYTDKIVIAHKGLSTVKVRAWDDAGNPSQIMLWEYKYDHNPPKIKISHDGGSYTRPLNIFFTTDEPAKVFYTLDGSAVTGNALLYAQSGISISRNDTTVFRYVGVDEAGNSTVEKSVTFFLDTRLPEVKVRIDGNLQDSSFLINLRSDEPATIYYTLDGTDPDISSSVYNELIQMRFGQILKYFAIDRIGNRSQIKVMDELHRPMVTANPDGGVYNRKLKISFNKNMNGTVYWRILPDTVFTKAAENVDIKENGIYNFEYFIENDAGIRSAVRRSVYFLDRTAPFVQVNLRKGNGDSVIVFFESSEPASIYFTTDGTNPLLSNTARSSGNKFTHANDRIVLKRSNDLKLAFYAEDVAGNQSAVTVLDVFRPRAVPNVPSGVDRLHDRILSITLNSYDQSTIYFERHGRKPTTASHVFSEPMTLMESDTITAFVIDASGHRGDIDTFIYLIDLPPSPQFSISPDTIYKEISVVFNPAGSLDKESSFETLQFRWDFNGDGIFDSDYGSYSKVQYKFDKCGLYKPVLEVIDENKRKAVISKTVLVRERCSPDMVSMIDVDGHAFCIDRYEWPNTAGVKPTTGVSWVEAKMSCADAGKRLCTNKEWKAACNGDVKTVYPYGDRYSGSACPTEGKGVWKSGSFSTCNKHGIADMLGNTWEWVESRDGDYRLMMGGSYLLGREAHCGLTGEGTVATRSNETGFRCCK